MELLGKLCVLVVVGRNKQDSSCSAEAEDAVPSTLIQSGITLSSVVCGTDCGTEVGEETGHLIPLSVESNLLLASEVETESFVLEKELSGNRMTLHGRSTEQVGVEVMHTDQPIRSW